jgi:hypothetical protein
MARWYWPRLPVRLMTTSHMNGAMVRHELAEFRIQHELAFAAFGRLFDATSRTLTRSDRRARQESD